ncbi:MAG TPA: ImmA/IrrE family metallo-endopeptidase [Candidatus Baltobacteraceae bacterium]|jgi:Zn-dependent peptidase ImmA (M78 family)
MGSAVEAAVRTAQRILKQNPQRLPIDVIAIAKAHGFSVDFEPFEDTLSGMFVREHRVIAVNKAHPRVRQRFTIAHELGHALLHAKSSPLFVDDTQIFHREQGRNSLREVQANRFAAELLMPEQDVRRVAGNHVELYNETLISQLARHFDVSSQAFSARLAALNLAVI